MAEPWNPRGSSVSEGDRDHKLVQFQAMTGLDDFDTCFAVLEQSNWDLNIAVNSLFEGTFGTSSTSSFPESDSRRERSSDTVTRDGGRPIPGPSSSLVSNLEPYITSALAHSPPTTYIDISEDDAPTGDQLQFKITWHGRLHDININSNATVGDLKSMVNLSLEISDREQVNLEGWPVDEDTLLDETRLSELSLSPVTYLALHSSAKVTVSAAEFKACNIPACQMPEVKDDDASSDNINVVDHAPRAIFVPQTSQDAQDNIIKVVVNYSGKDYKLQNKDTQVVRDIKHQMYSLTGIPTRRQEWIGWPPGAEDQSLLGDLDLAEPTHHLIMSALPSSTSSSSSQTAHLTNVINVDSGMDGNSDDTEEEEQMISDDGDDELFDQDVSPKKITPMLPNDSADTSEVLIQFVHQFEERYGEYHPPFFMGPLKEAIEDAAGATAVERKPLLIYLHHDSSILTNIFCSQILCSEHLVQYASQNFVTWGWDMTFESNRTRFVNMLVSHFGDAAASSVSRFRSGEYPLLLIVMKSKGGYNVCSILQANISLDELMSNLFNGYELFEQAKTIEVREEAARNARENMKQEQDAAYYESLAADRAKVAAEQERIRQEQEVIREEQMNAEIKEAERLSSAEQLPDEPSATTKNITTLRFRFPNGESSTRRFLASDKLKLVFTFAASKGYSIPDYRLLSYFPRKEVPVSESTKTLQELKLCPQETIFIEEV